MDKIESFKKIIDVSNNIVFFGGAGVSTESGIPDFRSQDGLYNQHYKFPPEEILSHTFFMTNTEEFYKFYREKMNSLKYEPNITHIKLAELEREGKLKAVVTQNIDGLHQKAGSKNVLEVHGTTKEAYCMNCLKEYPGEYIFNSNGIPKCECGGIVRPRVTLYGEMLPEDYVKAMEYISKADLLIVGGTSLTVEPASGLVRLFNGKHLVIVNNDITSYDYAAELVIRKPLGEVFSKLK